MTSRIQEWAAEQWFNGPEGGTPIMAERLNNIENQIEGLTQDMNTLTVDVTSIVKITQAAYDALDPKVETTLYLIAG